MRILAGQSTVADPTARVQRCRTFEGYRSLRVTFSDCKFAHHGLRSRGQWRSQSVAPRGISWLSAVGICQRRCANAFRGGRCPPSRMDIGLIDFGILNAGWSSSRRFPVKVKTDDIEQVCREKVRQHANFPACKSQLSEVSDSASSCLPPTADAGDSHGLIFLLAVQNAMLPQLGWPPPGTTILFAVLFAPLPGIRDSPGASSRQALYCDHQ